MFWPGRSARMGAPCLFPRNHTHLKAGWGFCCHLGTSASLVFHAPLWAALSCSPGSQLAALQPVARWQELLMALLRDKCRHFSVMTSRCSELQTARPVLSLAQSAEDGGDESCSFGGRSVRRRGHCDPSNSGAQSCILRQAELWLVHGGGGGGKPGRKLTCT
jgi:hypothetical protein